MISNLRLVIKEVKTSKMISNLSDTTLDELLFHLLLDPSLLNPSRIQIVAISLKKRRVILTCSV